MSEIDIHDYALMQYLSERWGDRFKGWTLNKNKDNFAIFMRVPESYLVADISTNASPEQLFFNEIRVPVDKYAITMYLKKVGGLEWPADNDFFERSEEKIKESLESFPDYFSIFNDASAGRIDLYKAEEMTNKIIEVWK